jgi:WhiB family redox-sensing transcriptional regulator
VSSWVDMVPCKTKGNIFFSEEIDDIRRSKRICLTCPFADKCLQIAINKEEIYGVWGGLSQRERRRYHNLFTQGISIEKAKEIVVEHGNKVLAKSN